MNEIKAWYMHSESLAASDIFNFFVPGVQSIRNCQFCIFFSIKILEKTGSQFSLYPTLLKCIICSGNSLCKFWVHIINLEERGGKGGG